MLYRLLRRQKARCHYNKLKKNQIRLLKLQPGSDNDRLVCTLQTVDLLAYDDISATSPIAGLERYEALSYVWGNASVTTEIHCESCALTMRQASKLILQAMAERCMSRKT